MHVGVTRLAFLIPLLSPVWLGAQTSTTVTEPTVANTSQTAPGGSERPTVDTTPAKSRPSPGPGASKSINATPLVSFRAFLMRRPGSDTPWASPQKNPKRGLKLSRPLWAEPLIISATAAVRIRTTPIGPPSSLPRNKALAHQSVHVP